MFDSDEQKKRAELIITLLAKLYVVLELSGDNCPVCHKALDHDPASRSAPSPSLSATTNL
jgi:hypothetical protein